VRDIALTLVILPLLAMALRHTWIGALLWTWLSLMNPHRLTYGFAQGMPFAAAAAAACFVSMLWAKGRVRLPMDLSVILLVLWTLWLGITTIAAINVPVSVSFFERAVKVLVMTVVCVAAIRERKHIELFVWVCALSIAFYGFKGGLFAIATGGSARVWGPGGSFIEGNNSLGLALVMILPLLFFLRGVSPHRWVRHGLLLTIGLCAISALSSQSRGAFLAITAMALMLWLRMRKKLLPGIALVMAGLLLITFMPASWEARMRTIETYEADDSAMQRISTWETAINVANDRVTGAGFYFAHPDVFNRYGPRPEWIFTAHSIYFQALGEHGYVGLALFLGIGGLTFWNAGRLRKEGAKRPDTQWVCELGSMVQVSMVGFAVGGAFLSLCYWDMPYNLLVIVVACKYWLKEQRWKDEPTGAFGATSAAQREARRPSVQGLPAADAAGAPHAPGLHR
jgi:probable O-glycosylation ligase (exosortase A-associated)